MQNWKQRTEMLLGKDKVQELQDKSVIVFGLGGVGAACAEALVRAGVGRVDLVDFDIIDSTNINRQIPALHSTIGQTKVEVCKKRFLDINPEANFEIYPLRYSEETKEKIEIKKYDYCIDAIDQVTAKLLLIQECQEHDVEVISAMGAGNKLHPELLEIAWLSETSICPLARIMRKEVKGRNLKDYLVVYSKEKPNKIDKESGSSPASISFVPPVAGYIMAGQVVRSLMKK